MEDIPRLERFRLRAQGSLYSLLYVSSDRLIAGASIRGWITVLLFLLSLFLGFRNRSLAWFIAGIIILVAVRTLYWLARRDGYIVFKTFRDEIGPLAAEKISDYQKLSIRTSGLFSVVGWEEYVLHQQAHLWRVPFGDYVVMIRQSNGRFLFQFVEVGYVKRIRSGCLVFGTRVVPALEVSFRTTWGPGAGESDFNWFSPSEGSEPKRMQRTIYLGFDSRSERDAIWIMLLEDNEKEIEQVV